LNVTFVGTRYHSRGIDDLGHVSNCVETEQIVCLEDGSSTVSSFVQLRGSIPVFWRQNINLRYKPPFEFYNAGLTSTVFARHFDALSSRYASSKEEESLVTAVNLVNHSGWEGELAKAFSREAASYDPKKLHYIAFDFNRNCPNMQWSRVNKLLEELSDDLQRQGFFSGQLTNGSMKSKTLQSGVIRTNCIDCLDRTNLVQSTIARRILDQQLAGMDSSIFDQLFKLSKTRFH